MLKRFIEAQNKYYIIANSELKNGRKESHWMWFIFPQIIGLGKSEISKYYAISNVEEAEQYMENEYLRSNYDSLCKILLKLKENDVTKIFGDIDSLKLHSSLTLFYTVSKKEIYKKVLNKFFEGKLDYNTSIILRKIALENKMKEDTYCLRELNLTEEQEKFLIENDLIELVKESISHNNLICADLYDYKMILNRKEIVGYINNDNFKNIKMHKFKDAINPQVMLYVKGAQDLTTLQSFIDIISKQFGDINCTICVGNGESEKVFALITSE